VADLESFSSHVDRMIALIPRDGSTVDLQELFFRLTLDSATEFLFGESVNSLTAIPGSTNDFAEAFNYAQACLMQRAVLGPALFLYNNPKFDKACSVVHDYADRLVVKALSERDMKRDDTRYVFLHELVKQTADPKELRDQLLNILLAGRDTTAGLLSNMFFELARRPEIWAKLKVEVKALDGHTPTFETIRDLTYLKYCINEGEHHCDLKCD
jgi:cytochrome P450